MAMETADRALEESHVTAGETRTAKAGGRADWFREAKFGLFIHWGLYAVPAGVWEGKPVKFIGEWIMRWVRIPRAVYRRLAEQFNPARFDADVWTRLAAEAGMKYLVITAKHHDGFAMFDSKASDYNIVKATPFGRDPMAELSAAARRHGLRFGFYYSHAQDWDEANAAGNDWDFQGPRDPAEYLRRKAMPQVRELLTQYGPLCHIWFDTPQLLSREDCVELERLVRDLQPGCLVNSRLGHGLGDYEQMPDNEVPSEVHPELWEVPATLNDTWGYKIHDDNWKSADSLIRRLCDIVSKGGCYLLNVGPDAMGEIPAPSVERLRAVGQWLRRNGEAVYGTTHSPLRVNGRPWRCAARPGRLYFHLPEWPGETFELDGLLSPVKRAWLLADPGRTLSVRQADGRLTVAGLPARAPDAPVSVLAVDLADATARITPAEAFDAPTDVIRLPCREGSAHGFNVHYYEADDATRGFEIPRDRMRWRVVVHGPGVFRVEALCAGGAGPARFQYQLEAAGAVEADLGGSGQDEFQWRAMGEVRIAASGLYHAHFATVGETQSGLRLREVRLTRVG